MAPSMVAPSRPDLWPSTGTQQQEFVRPDDSSLSQHITSATQLPQPHTYTSCPSSARAALGGGLQWVRDLGLSSGGGAHRVQLLELVKYILRNFTQNLNLRLLSAKAARVFLLTVLDEASAAQTTSSTLEDQERASKARNLASKQNEALTAHTAGTQRQPLTRADLGSRRPKRRGKRGSGACRKAGQPSAEYHPSHLS